jgi:tetratricopeptide (TPR) repeat protein
MVYEMLATNAAQQLSLIPVLKADTAYEAKKFDEAIALYDEAIKINPQNPGAYSNKALALTQAGRFDEALASINRALEINPGDERAVQVKKAVDTFIENAAREKENAQIKQANDILNEGNKLLDTDASSALKKYEEANSLTGEKQSVIWRQVGRARAKLKQDSEAVAAFRKAIELASAEQAEDYQMSLAQYYLDAKRPDEALDVVVAGSKNPEQRLMDLYTRGKNNKDSMAFSTAALERVVKLNPANIDAAFELGQVYYMDRKDSQAQELLTRYVENGKDAGRIQTAKDLLTVIGSRNKPKP